MAFREAYPAGELAENFVRFKAAEAQALAEALWGGSWPDELTMPDLALLASWKLLEDYWEGFLQRAAVLREFRGELEELGRTIQADDSKLVQLLVLERRWVTCTLANRLFEVEWGRVARKQLPPPVETTSYNLTRYLKNITANWARRHGHPDL